MRRVDEGLILLIVAGELLD